MPGCHLQGRGVEGWGPALSTQPGLLDLSPTGAKRTWRPASAGLPLAAVMIITAVVASTVHSASMI